MLADLIENVVEVIELVHSSVLFGTMHESDLVDISVRFAATMNTRVGAMMTVRAVR